MRWLVFLVSDLKLVFGFIWMCGKVIAFIAQFISIYSNEKLLIMDYKMSMYFLTIYIKQF